LQVDAGILPGKLTQYSGKCYFVEEMKGDLKRYLAVMKDMDNRSIFFVCLLLKYIQR